MCSCDGAAANGHLVRVEEVDEMLLAPVREVVLLLDVLQRCPVAIVARVLACACVKQQLRECDAMGGRVTSSSCENVMGGVPSI